MSWRQRAGVAARVTLCTGLPVLAVSVVEGWLLRRNMVQREAGVAACGPESYALLLTVLGFGGAVVGPVFGLVWARSRGRAVSYVALVPVYFAFFPWVALSPVSFLFVERLLTSAGLSPSAHHPWIEATHAMLYTSLVFLAVLVSAAWRGGSARRDLAILAVVAIGTWLLVAWWGPPMVP